MLSDPGTVRDCLTAGEREWRLPRLEAQMLLSHVLGKPRVWLIAHDDQALTDEEFEAFQGLCQRRMAGEPIAYLVGEREFMGLAFHVTPAVLIPRPETELLVETALKALAGRHAPHVLDLGTGSGAIAVALAHARPDAQVWATDISAEALEIARRNAARHDVEVGFLSGTWFEPFAHAVVEDDPESSCRFDAIVSNPPYIPMSDAHLTEGDLRFEPKSALTDNADGLSAYRVLTGEALKFLVPGGCLCVEHGFDQGPAVFDLFEAAGFVDIKTIRDLAGHPRVTAGFYNR